MKESYPFRTTTAKVVELIEVDETWGEGTEQDPCRRVRSWFTKSGYCVAINDPIHSHERMDYENSKGM